MRVLVLLALIAIATVSAESEASCCAGLSARISKLEELVEKRLDDKLEHMLEARLEEKLQDMLEKRLELQQQKAETYANEAVRVARQELIKSERFVIKTADEHAERCTAKVNGLETKLSQEVDAVENAASEHRQNIDQKITTIPDKEAVEDMVKRLTPDKEAVEDMVKRLRRLETNATAEVKELYKAMKESDDKLDKAMKDSDDKLDQAMKDSDGKLASQVKKTEDTVKVHNQSLGDSSGALKQMKEIAEEVKTNFGERRTQTYINVGAYDAASATFLGTGCATVSLAANNVGIDLATTACGADTDKVCPDCWIITTAHATNKLTLTNCATAKVTSSATLGAASTAWATAMRSYTIVNADTSTVALVSDGTSTWQVASKSSVVAHCYTGGSNALYWPNTYFTTLNVGGSANSGLAHFGGSAAFDNLVWLGDDNSDTITIKGHVTTALNPNIDFSGSSGTCSGAAAPGGATCSR